MEKHLSKENEKWKEREGQDKDPGKRAQEQKEIKPY